MMRRVLAILSILFLAALLMAGTAMAQDAALDARAAGMLWASCYPASPEKVILDWQFLDATDSSGNNYHPSAVRDAPMSAGILGPLAGGRAGGYALNTTVGLDTIENLAFSIWINPATTNANWPFSTYATAFRQYELQMRPDFGYRWSFIWWDVGGAGYRIARATNSPMPPGAWAHVVCVRAGTNLVVYENAVDVTTRIDIKEPAPTNAADGYYPRVGTCSYVDTERNFSGSLARFRILKNITEEEIKSLYLEGPY